MNTHLPPFFIRVINHHNSVTRTKIKTERKPNVMCLKLSVWMGKTHVFSESWSLMFSCLCKYRFSYLGRGWLPISVTLARCQIRRKQADSETSGDISKRANFTATLLRCECGSCRAPCTHQRVCLLPGCALVDSLLLLALCWKLCWQLSMTLPILSNPDTN